MRRAHRRLALAVLVACACATPAVAATYKDRSVDRVRYHARISNGDYGTYDNVEVKFHGDHADVYFPRGGRLVLLLEDEVIVDPHEIVAHDPLRGITWEVDVRDLER